ncbi:MAG: hypothetical protein QGG61_08985, partial [Arenicellales bacterium]|nr:hypothetical protein [Arenicellales bacterium]
LLQKIIIGLFVMILIAGGLAVSGCSIETHNNVSTGEGSAGDTDTDTDTETTTETNTETTTETSESTTN